MSAERVKPVATNCRVLSNRWLTSTVFELRFTIDPQQEFKAGQFISILIPGAGPNGRDLRRAYSIASAPETNPIELCVKKVEGGPGTTYLSGLQEGNDFKAFFPYGNFLYSKNKGKQAFFVSTGTGLAPFRSMIFSKEYQNRKPKTAYCLFGVREESEILYADEFSKHPEVHWIPCLSRPKEAWSGFTGRVSHYLKNEMPENFAWKDTEFYLCGNGDMIKEIKEFLESKGLGKESVFFEKYY